MYSKTLITKLFEDYVASKKPEDLEALIVACRPLIATLLTKYTGFEPYADDVCQEVLIRLWKNFGNTNRLQKELVNPHVFIFSKVRSHLFSVLKQYARQYGIAMRLTEREKEVIDMRDKMELSFGDIAHNLGIETVSVKIYYCVAHSKIDNMLGAPDNEKSLAEQADQSSLDPAKRYEMKDLERVWQERIEELAAHHPVLSRSIAGRRMFSRFMGDMLMKEVDDLG